MPEANSATLMSEANSSYNLEQARALVAYLEAGDIQGADSIIDCFVKSRDDEMFREVGRLTRQVHETINDLDGDTRLNSIMRNEMPEARHNLDHVIRLTEDAAHKTLSAIERSVPLLESISHRTGSLKQILEQQVGKIPGENGNAVIEVEVNNYLDSVSDDLKSINQDMNVVLLAQSYQDISGQIIQRVNKMVQDVEHSLVGILKSNSHYVSGKETASDNTTNDAGGYGPAVPGMNNGDVMQNQDEVDDLLSNLGF